MAQRRHTGDNNPDTSSSMIPPPPPNTHNSTFTSHYMTPHWSTVRPDRQVGWRPRGSIRRRGGPVRGPHPWDCQIGMWSDAAPEHQINFHPAPSHGDAAGPPTHRRDSYWYYIHMHTLKVHLNHVLRTQVSQQHGVNVLQIIRSVKPQCLHDNRRQTEDTIAQSVCLTSELRGPHTSCVLYL